MEIGLFRPGALSGMNSHKLIKKFIHDRVEFFIHILSGGSVLFRTDLGIMPSKEGKREPLARGEGKGPKGNCFE